MDWKMTNAVQDGNRYPKSEGHDVHYMTANYAMGELTEDVTMNLCGEIQI